MSLGARLCAEDIKSGPVHSTLNSPFSVEGDRCISGALNPGLEANGEWGLWLVFIQED